MERRLSNATGRLKSFKELLSSTKNGHKNSRSHHNLTSDIPANNTQDSNGNGTEESSKRHRKSQNNKKNSLSLFDLVDPPMSSSRPQSMALSVNLNIHQLNDTAFRNKTNQNSNNIGKSVSLHGLTQNHCRASDNPTSSAAVKKNSNSSRNPAVRLFHSIRAKFGLKRRRDRQHKIADSSKTADFGSFFSTSTDTNSAAINDNSIQFHDDDPILSSSRSHESILQARHSGSRINVEPLESDIDDTFAASLGSRIFQSSSTATAVSMPQISTLDGENSFRDFQDSNSQLQPEDQGSPNFIPEEPKPPIPLKQRGGRRNGELSSSSARNNNSGGTIKASLSKELCDLVHEGWYWGGMSKEEAEEKLKSEPDGAFVVRDSSSNHYLLSLSFNSNGKTLHTRIEYRNGKFCFYSSETECFPSVAELIDYWITNSEQGMFCYSRSRQRNADMPSYPVRLTKPISRFTEVKSLSHLSRFVIRRYTRLDLIPQLPLPQSLIDFVGESRYI